MMFRLKNAHNNEKKTRPTLNDGYTLKKKCGSFINILLLKFNKDLLKNVNQLTILIFYFVHLLGLLLGKLEETKYRNLVATKIRVNKK